MKRSSQVVLAISGVVTLTLVGCGDSYTEPRTVIQPENTYTNNQYVSGAGYYHAPFRAWYPYTYDYHDASRGYYRGGQWYPTPDIMPIQTSRPTMEAATHAQAAHDSAVGTRRGGFGSSSRSSSS
jgi:hypothetical protein